MAFKNNVNTECHKTVVFCTFGSQAKPFKSLRNEKNNTCTFPEPNQILSVRVLIILMVQAVRPASNLTFEAGAPGIVQLNVALPVIPNPVTAAVHTMANPIITQLCEEIMAHVGY